MELKAIAIAVTLGCVATDQLCAQTRPLTIGQLVGCYEASVSVPRQRGESKFFEGIPRRFRLDGPVVSMVGSIFTWHRVGREAKAGRDEGSTTAAWAIQTGDSLRVVWDDGFVGFGYLFASSRDTLRGVAHYESDVVGNSHDTAAIAWRTACGPGA